MRIRWPKRRAARILSIALILFFTSSAHYGTRAAPSPSLSVSGGIQTPAGIQALVFAWKSSIALQGSGWSPGEAVSITLAGPLNSPGVSPSSIALGTVNAVGDGSFSASPVIPYDQGIIGPQASIPRPGLYAVQGNGTVSGTVSAARRINLCPATYVNGSSSIDWGHDRGGRDGVLPGPLSKYSPERSDPEWVSVWDSRPVEVYGTVEETSAGGADQPARISWQDDPILHYGHDTNFNLLPDPPYRWTMGTANSFVNEEDPEGVALGRIKLEWEVLNNGSTKTYGEGQIGLPSWATPTTGDRVYVLGRWVLDAGHPEVGARTEIHPPRLIAVMRQRPTISSRTLAASQVDICVSGHGGGANMYPAGLDTLLNQGGHGGGRVRDVLSADDQQIYYRPGPASFLEAPILNILVQQLTGLTLSQPIYATAGPSAFSWGTPAPEIQPIKRYGLRF